MQFALRPYVTTGIALVGASVIAISPISPVTSDLHLPTINTSSVAVELAAAITPTIDPFNAWVQVAAGVVGNVAVLGQQVWENGAPVLTQILANQVGYIQGIGTAVQNTITGLQAWPSTTLSFYLDYASVLFEAGQVGEAFQYVVYGLATVAYPLFPMLNIFDIPGAIAQNFGNVVAQLRPVVMQLGLDALILIEDPFLALGGQIQAFVDAVNAGDPLSAVNAVLNVPAAMVNAVLNGHVFSGVIGNLAHTLLVTIPDMIAAAIKPPAPPVAPAAVETAPDTLVAEVSSISSTAISALGGAGTITLSPAIERPDEETPAAEAPVEETPAAETPVVDAPAEETPATETPVVETPVDETPVDSEPSEDDDTPGTGTGTGTGNGATDLSGGNKVTPGQTHSGTTKPNTGSETATEPTAPTESETSTTTGGTSAGTSTDSGSNAGNDKDNGGGADKDSGSGSDD